MATPENVPVTTTVDLDTPIRRGETQIERLALRKPAAGELRGLSMTNVLNCDAETLIKLIPRVSEPALTEHEVRQMDVADFTEIANEFTLFFVQRKHKAKLSLDE